MRKGIWTLFFIILFSCNTDRKQKEFVNEVKEIPPSRTNIEVNFSAAELEDGVNAVLKTQILDAALPIGKPGDTLFLKIKKDNKLNLAVKGLTAYAEIPLEIEVALKQKVMGFKISTTNSPVQFKGTAKAKTDFAINDRWELELNCEWLGMDLLTTPTLKVMGFKIDIEDIVNDQLEKHQSKISNAICKALRQTVDFRGMMIKVWSDLQKPIKVAQQPVPIYLHIDPSSLGASLRPKEDTLSIITTLVSNFSLSPITKKANTKPLPKKTLPEKNADYFLAYVNLNVPFDELSQLAELQLGRMPIAVQGYQAVVKTVDIGSNGDGNVKIDLNLEGDYTGGVTVIGRPTLSDKYIVSVKDFDFELKPEGELADAADWMLEEFIGSYISQYLEFDIGKQIDQLDSIANAGVAKEPLGEKIDFNLNINQVQSYFLNVQEDQISWVLTVDGQIAIDLKKGIFDKKS